MDDLRWLASQLTQPCVLLEADARCVHANPAFEARTGVPAGRALGHGWLSAVGAQDRDRVRQEVDATGSGEIRFSARCIDNAALLPVRAKVREPDRPAGHRMCVWHLDPAAKADRDLILARFETILEYAPIMIDAFDSDGNCLLWNRQCVETLGYTMEEIQASEDPLALFYPDAQQKQKVIENIQKADSIFREYQVVTRSQEVRRQIWADFSPLPGEIISVGYDVTEQRESEDRRRELADELRQANEELRQRTRSLERSNAELEQFAYVASHDLQEPLRMVATYLGLLERRFGADLDERAHKYVDYAVQGAKRMQSLLADLLEYSRAGGESTRHEPVDLQAVVADAWNAVDPHGQASLQVGHLPTVQGHRTHLLRAFQNLFSNSLKFAQPSGPRVTVHCTREGSWQHIEVRDDGIGFEPKYNERIFEMYQRLHERERYGGNGMGLAIVKKVIELHGGHVRAQGRAPDGCSFFITLPGAES